LSLKKRCQQNPTRPNNLGLQRIQGSGMKNVGKLQKQTAERMLKLGVVSEHNMCCEHNK
jgi:hypothetical protein